MRFDAPPGLDADRIVMTEVTAGVDRGFTEDGSLPDPLASGHYRSPLPLADGTLIAAHTGETRLSQNDGTTEAPRYRYAYRLVKMKAAGDLWVAGEPLTPGITASISYWSPDLRVTFERRALGARSGGGRGAHERPARRVAVVQAPEGAILDATGVELSALRAWLAKNELALIVSRDVTLRDRGDVQQPYNLRVPGGVQTVGTPGKVYDVSCSSSSRPITVRGYESTEPRPPGARGARCTSPRPRTRAPPAPRPRAWPSPLTGPWRRSCRRGGR